MFEEADIGSVEIEEDVRSRGGDDREPEMLELTSQWSQPPLLLFLQEM